MDIDLTRDIDDILKDREEMSPHDQEIAIGAGRDEDSYQIDCSDLLMMRKILRCAKAFGGTAEWSGSYLRARVPRDAITFRQKGRRVLTDAQRNALVKQLHG
jgi:hypothetical protein